MKLDPKRAAEELLRREQARARVVDVEKAIRAELFDKQLAVWDDPSRLKAALCTRRAGKTELWTRYCVAEVLKKPKSLVRIWAQSRLRVKQLLWQPLKSLCARHKIPVQAHDTELTLRFPNASEIRLVGADRDQSAQRKRGDATVMEVILEAQSWGPFLRSLVEDVAGPSLFDNKGTLCMEGTPGPLPTGLWFYITGENDLDSQWQSKGVEVEGEVVGAGWSCHRWSLLDNPKMPRWAGAHNWRELAHQAVKEEREGKGWTESHPSYIREYTGRWVRDDTALYYAFNAGRNTFSLDEVQPWGPGWSHCLGWDLGFRDDMALVVWGWQEHARDVYEAFSWSQPGASSEEVMAQISDLDRRGFNFIAKVADTGGGGKMFVEDVMSRYSQIFEAAKKTDKYAHVKIMNDDLIAGRIRLQRGGAYAQEMSCLPKDPNWDILSGKPPGEDPRFPNHRCDAGLYSYRKSLAFLSQALPPSVPLEDRVEAYDEEMLSRVVNDDEWWEGNEDYD